MNLVESVKQRKINIIKWVKQRKEYNYMSQAKKKKKKLGQTKKGTQLYESSKERNIIKRVK